MDDCIKPSLCFEMMREEGGIWGGGSLKLGDAWHQEYMLVCI